MHYFFDMDGVLVCSSPITRRAAREVLAEYGITPKEDDFRPFTGAGEARLVGGVAEAYGVAYQPVMKDKLYEKYLRYVKEGLQVYPGAADVLKELKAGGKQTALCSSADMIKIKANMEAAGISLTLFDTVVSGNDAENKKPSPDIFLAAAHRLNVKPADCLVIEDALTGIQAAKSAGMRCAAVTTSFSRRQLEEEQPDFVIDSLSEILRIQ